MIRAGRVCYKIAGRDAGQKVLVLSRRDNEAEIIGPRKKRTVSIKHLEPIDEEIDQNLKKEEILQKLGYKKSKKSKGKKK